MTTLRTLRRTLGLTQAEHAALLGVPLNTFRMWDSGLRAASPEALARSEGELARRTRDAELVGLRTLADEFRINIHTLRAAVREGRLEAVLSARTVFGVPRRTATRSAVALFLATQYRRPLRFTRPTPLRLPPVPDDFDRVVIGLRHRLQLSQDALAEAIGAAGKAVVYQWESRKRRPSPILWARISALLATGDTRKGNE